MKQLIFLLLLFSSCTKQNSSGNQLSSPVETISKAPIYDHSKDNEPSTNDNGIIFFSFDNGDSWENKSIGLQSCNLTDPACFSLKLLFLLLEAIRNWGKPGTVYISAFTGN